MDILGVYPTVKKRPIGPAPTVLGLNSPDGAAMTDRPDLGRTDQVSDSGGFARELASTSGPTERLSVGIGIVAEIVSGCDHIGITQVTKNGLATAAASDDVVRLGDRWQYELQEGPCVDTVRRHETVLSLDLTHERRWPRWAPRVVEQLGIGSMLSLLLYTHDRSYGALNLYADRVDAFTADDLAVAHSLAAHLAVAVAAEEQIAHLGVAVTSRTIIGQAEGILMERLQVDADQAFAYLRRISQQTNRKLIAVATDLVRTRQLPAATRPADTHRKGGG